MAISYDGTRATVYVDGVAQSAFNAERKFSNPGSGNVIRFGNRADSAPDCVWTGDLDEFRFRSAASSADWVAAEYASVATDGWLPRVRRAGRLLHDSVLLAARRILGFSDSRVPADRQPALHPSLFTGRGTTADLP